MKVTELGCFRCNTGVDRSAEAPWNWSVPRALCPPHKVAVEMEDGQLLDAVLERVTPADDPLEGSLLGWIFNPVFLKVSADQETRCWTDFVGGGMAILEDRFFATVLFKPATYLNSSADARFKSTPT